MLRFALGFLAGSVLATVAPFAASLAAAALHERNLRQGEW